MAYLTPEVPATDQGFLGDYTDTSNRGPKYNQNGRSYNKSVEEVSAGTDQGLYYILFSSDDCTV